MPPARTLFAVPQSPGANRRFEPTPTGGRPTPYAQLSAHNRLADRGGNALKILIADDDSGIRQMIRRVLMADLRADVDEAPDGVNVLLALQSTTFDLLIMDIEMGPLDGLDTLEAIRKVPSMRSLPVVMITGNADASRVTRLRELGVNDIVAKPVSLSVLRERLVPLLSRTALPSITPPRDSRLWPLRSSDRVLVVGDDAATARVIEAELGRVCSVTTVACHVTALRQITQRPPDAVFLTSANELVPPPLFAKAVRQSAAARSRLYLCSSARALGSGMPMDGFDGQLPVATDALSFARAIRTYLTDGGMSRILLSTHSLPIVPLAEITRALLEQGIGDAFRIQDGRPSGHDYEERSVEVNAAFDVDGTAWHLLFLATQPTAIRHASRDFGGDVDTVSDSSAVGSVARLSAEIATQVCAALAEHSIDADLGRVNSRSVRWIDSDVWEELPGPQPIAFESATESFRAAVRVIPPRV